MEIKYRAETAKKGLVQLFDNEGNTAPPHPVIASDRCHRHILQKWLRHRGNLIKTAMGLLRSDPQGLC